MSVESGISTFRDSNGSGESYAVMKVASIESWYENPGLMLEFYSERPVCLLSGIKQVQA